MVDNYVYYKIGGDFTPKGLSRSICFAEYNKQFSLGNKEDLIFLFNPFPDFTKEDVEKIVRSFKDLKVKLKWVEHVNIKYGYKKGEKYPLILVPKTNSLAQIKLFFHVIRYFHESKEMVEAMKTSLEIKKELKNKHILPLIIFVASYKYRLGHSISCPAVNFGYQYTPYKTIMNNYKTANSFSMFCIYHPNRKITLDYNQIKELFKLYEKNRYS